MWWNTKDTIGGENFSEGERERGREEVVCWDTILKRTGSPKEFRSMEKGPGGVVWQYSFYLFEVPSEFLIPFLYSITSTFSTFNVAESLGETLLRFLFVTACTKNITLCPIGFLILSFP